MFTYCSTLIFIPERLAFLVNVYNYIITGFCQLHELSAVTEYDSSHITFLLLHMTLYDIAIALVPAHCVVDCNVGCVA